MPWSRETAQLIDSAIWEDLGPDGDITAALLPDPDRPVSAHVVAREPGVICGLALLPQIMLAFARRLEAALQSDPPDHTTGRRRDGRNVSAGARVATLRGPHAAVLTAERTVLNFLTRLSGVATLTRRYVSAARAANPRIEVLDTRKTVPGWRELDKYAVHCGGGANHRFGLYDAVLIKDNHIAGVPVAQLAAWLRQRLDALPQTVRPAFIEVEVDSLDQLQAVLEVRAIDVVLIDNFTPADMRAAVRLRDEAGGGRPLLEVSGGVRLETVAEYAATGVDRISIGALTHSAVGLDLGLDLD